MLGAVTLHAAVTLPGTFPWQPTIPTRDMLHKTTAYCHVTARPKAAVKLSQEAWREVLELAIDPPPKKKVFALFTTPSPLPAWMLLKVSEAVHGDPSDGCTFGNHQATPPISPAKTGAVMSPLHEGSVNDMSRCTGWHTNCTCSTRTGE